MDRFAEIAGTRALNWLNANKLEILARNTACPEEASLTALAEVSMLGSLLLERSKSRFVTSTARSIIDFALSNFAEPAVLKFYRQGPREAVIGLVLTWLWLPQKKVERILSSKELSRILEERGLHKHIGSALRTLEWRWALDKLGASHQLPQIADIAQSCLSDLLGKSPTTLSIPEGYLATHTIFYATDFGRKPHLLTLGLDVDAIFSFISKLLCQTIEWQHWDLTAELLFCCNCFLSRKTTAQIEPGWKHIIWPAPGLSDTRLS